MVRRHAYQLDCVGAQHFGIFSPAVFDSEVVSPYPSQLPQSIFEGCHTRQSFRVVGGKAHQHANLPHPLGLLRARGERPCSRCTERTEKFAPPHVPPQAQEKAS
jgi:hypothetical protein